MKLFITISTCLILAASADAQSNRKVTADKIVGIVGDKIILQSDVSNEILDRHRRGEPLPADPSCQVLEHHLVRKAMLLQAERDSITISEAELEATLDNRLRAYAELLNYKDECAPITGARSIDQLKSDFRPAIRDVLLIERLREQVAGAVNITPQEVKKYFAGKQTESLPYYPSAIELGEIVLYPKPSAELDKHTMDELNELRQDIASGRQKMDVITRLYSDDRRTRDAGGLISFDRSARQLELPLSDPAFLNHIYRLTPGQFSPVFKTREGYHLVQLIERSGDYYSLRHLLRIPKADTEASHLATLQLDTVRARLIAGTINFKEAVAKYSEGRTTKMTGGYFQNESGYTQLNLSQLDKTVILQLDQARLQPGQYSAPLSYTDANGKQAVRILYFKARTAPHQQNLQDDYDRIAEEALADKKQQVLENWLKTKRPSWYVMIDPGFASCATLGEWARQADPLQ